MAYGSVLTDTVQSSTAATAPVFKDGNGTQIGTLCRAWVNFNGTGTVAIRGSFNVSSITDNGTGDYTVNFTTAMPNVNYSMTSATQVTGTVDVGVCSYHPSTSPSTSSVRVLVSNRLAVSDNPIVAISVFR